MRGNRKRERVRERERERNITSQPALSYERMILVPLDDTSILYSQLLLCSLVLKRKKRLESGTYIIDEVFGENQISGKTGNSHHGSSG